ncbi:hypothetical protein KC361_g223 [Hortaea werneckii]|nr:hypothetical protein KC361_g223 [Hortaea werneckii]
MRLMKDGIPETCSLMTCRAATIPAAKTKEPTPMSMREDTGAGDDHHGSTVSRDVGFDRERIKLLAINRTSGVLRLAIRARFYRGSGRWLRVDTGLQVSGDRGERDEPNENLRCAGIDCGRSQDAQAMEEKVHSGGREGVGLEKALSGLQDRPQERCSLQIFLVLRVHLSIHCQQSGLEILTFCNTSTRSI